MTTTPIFLKDLSFILPNKICFEDFNTVIHPGDRIGIIGRNGSGKTTILKMIQGQVEPTSGHVHIEGGITTGYVPQIIEEYDTCSGGERFNKALTEALSDNPDVLLLDEPTNHLDRANRTSLMRMLRSFPGTLLVVSHDRELLRTCVDKFWYIDQGQIEEFTSSYDDFVRELKNKRMKLEEQIKQLNANKKQAHQDLMQEQRRASKSKAKGQKSIDQRKWPTVVSKAKATRAEQTSGRKRAAIDQKKQELVDQLESLRLPDVIVPHFALPAGGVKRHALLSVSEGSIAYNNKSPLLSNIYLTMTESDRMAITGNNGSGKTTLIKAILGDPEVTRSGQWYLPGPSDIGYLDQHYGDLNPEVSVLDSLAAIVPSWSNNEIRQHLNNFLFRKNEEINMRVKDLSGGEKARLSLSLIAAKPPQLLILDEITNNLDMETVDHVIQILRGYPGGMIVISHDTDFIKEVGGFTEVCVRQFQR